MSGTPLKKFVVLFLLIWALSCFSRSEDYSPWKSLVSYRPPSGVQALVSRQSLPNFPWYVQPIEGPRKASWFGGGSDVVNLDDYAVRVSIPPKIDGTALDGVGLLEYIRKNLSDFLDPSSGRVDPVGKDGQIGWKYGIPGTVLVFKLNLRGVNVGIPHVVLAEQGPQSWKFCTIMAGEHSFPVPLAAHPVSGVREFGYRKVSDGVEIYTSGADRVTTFYASNSSAVLEGGEEMWRGFQKRVTNFVNSHGGSATPPKEKIHRPNWSQVKSQIHQPSEIWQ